MNKTKTLGIVVGILAFINICLLVFLFVGRPKGPKPGGFASMEKGDSFIQQRFGFDADQMAEFRISKDKHIDKSGQLQSQLKNLSLSYYTTEDENKRQIRDSLLIEINAVSNEIYANNITHFDEVGAICKNDQKSEMENFIKGLLDQKANKGKNR